MRKLNNNMRFGVSFQLNPDHSCIFLKRWIAYNETMRGEMHEYQEETIA